MTLEQRQQKLWAIYLDIAESKHKDSDIKKLKILAKTINKIDRLLVDTEIAEQNRKTATHNVNKFIDYLERAKVPQALYKYINEKLEREPDIKEQLQKEPLRTYCNGLYNSINIIQEEKLKEVFNTSWPPLHKLLTSKTEQEAREQLKIVKEQVLKLDITEVINFMHKIFTEPQRKMLGYIMDFQF